MSAVDLVTQIVGERDPGCMVTKFVVIAEVIDPEGERGVWTETHEDALRWDTYGLLVEALQAEKARQIAEEIEGDEE